MTRAAWRSLSIAKGGNIVHSCLRLSAAALRVPFQPFAPKRWSFGERDPCAASLPAISRNKLERHQLPIPPSSSLQNSLDNNERKHKCNAIFIDRETDHCHRERLFQEETTKHGQLALAGLGDRSRTAPAARSSGEGPALCRPEQASARQTPGEAVRERVCS